MLFQSDINALAIVKILWFENNSFQSIKSIVANKFLNVKSGKHSNLMKWHLNSK